MPLIGQLMFSFCFSTNGVGDDDDDGSETQQKTHCRKEMILAYTNVVVMCESGNKCSDKSMKVKLPALLGN